MCRFMSKHGSEHYVLFCHNPLSRLDIRQLSFDSPWVDRWDTPGEPRGTQGGMVQFGICFFPAGEGNCLVLDTSSLNHGDIPTGFVRVSVAGKCFVWYHGR